MKSTTNPLKKSTLLLALCSLTVGFQNCNEMSEKQEQEEIVEQEIPAFDLAIAKAEIEEANKNFMALVAAGDSVGLAKA
jgi:hypothetical protein